MKRITIGFRLSETDQGRLETAAAKAGISPHELAKDLTLKGLRGARVEPKSEGSSDSSEVAILRRDLALAIQTLLVVARIFSPEDAARWTREKFHLTN